MSLSEAPSVKITYHTAQDISDEILGGVIQYCRETGYKQNMMMLTFFWSAFLFSSSKQIEENGLVDEVLNCFVHSLKRVFPKVSADAELQKSISDMRQHYWERLSVDFNSLHNEAELLSFTKIANELNLQGSGSTNNLIANPAKSFSKFSSTINSSIYNILHDIDNGFCIQYKHVLDSFRYSSANQEPKANVTKSHTTTSCNTSSIPTQTNEPPLGMAWYKFLIYFALIAGAVINFIYSISYIFGGIYLVETNGKVSAEQVYAYYGVELQIIDVLYGFFLIAFCVLAIILRQKLVNYKPDSLKFIKIVYSLSAGVPLLYAILASTITEQSLPTQAVTSVIIGLLFLVINVTYFKKRAHLFVEKTPIAKSPRQNSTQPPRVYKSNNVSEEPKSNVAEQPTIKFCRKCGAKLHDEGSFCHKCGTKTILNNTNENADQEQTTITPVEKLALLTVGLPAFVAESCKEEPNFVKNDLVYCEAIIFAEFFIRAKVLEFAPSKDMALKFSDDFVLAVTKNTIEALPDAKDIFVNMFYDRTAVYDNIMLTSSEPTQEIIEVLSHVIHKEVDENRYVEVSDKNFRYFGGIITNTAIRIELVALFESMYSCAKEAIDELINHLKSM